MHRKKNDERQIAAFRMLAGRADANTAKPAFEEAMRRLIATGGKNPSKKKRGKKKA